MLRVWRFSVFELDEASGELTRGGRGVALTHQAFIVLRLLASRAGDVVTREELRRALWSDGTHVDFDRGLNFCVASVRRALGDNARRPRFVETVTRRGYRFIADVRIVDVHAESAPAVAEMPAPVVTSSRWTPSLRRWALAAAIPLLFAQQPALVRAHTRANASPRALAAFERGDFESAIALDGLFAEAHFALGARYQTLGAIRAMPQRVAFERARAATSRAVALEEAPEARKLLGLLRLALDWDVDGARAEIARALEMAPDWDIGLTSYAEVLSAAGNDAAALEAISRAEAVSPSCDLVARQSAVLHYRAHDYDRALAKLDRARELGDAWGRANDHEWLVDLHDLALRIYVQQHRWPEAHRAALALVSLYGGTAAAVKAFTAMPARAAVEQFFSESADILQGPRHRDTTPSSRVALIDALAGRDDDALGWLERAASARDGDLLLTLRDPALDRLRGTPRFEAVVSATVSRRVSTH